MRILFLTDNFPPEVNAPASRTFEHCREWVKAGHEVTVVTGAPNFPKGRVFQGYRNNLLRREVMEGIQVLRVWTYITANEGFVKRTLDYVSFMLSAIPVSLTTRRPDIIIVTSPQFFTACAGYVVSRLRGIPYIFELRDLWPESIRAVGAMRASPVLDAIERLELFLYRKAGLVIPVTHAFKRDLERRGIDPAKIHVVTNGVDLSRFQKRPRNAQLAARLGLEGRLVAGYIGTHGMAHALQTVLEAASILQREGRDDLRLLMLGDGAAKAMLHERARSLGLRNVIFLDSVPKDEVIDYWSLLDISIVHLRDTELFTTVIPSKIFESMAMGIPVVHGVRGESSDIVRDADAGLVFDPEDPAMLRDRLVELADNPALLARLGANAVAGARGYDRTQLAQTMLSHIQGFLASRT